MDIMTLLVRWRSVPGYNKKGLLWVAFKCRYLVIKSLQRLSSSVEEFKESQEKLFIELYIDSSYGCLLPYWNYCVNTEIKMIHMKISNNVEVLVPSTQFQ